jgi:hypothetical protein
MLLVARWLNLMAQVTLSDRLIKQQLHMSLRRSDLIFSLRHFPAMQTYVHSHGCVLMDNPINTPIEQAAAALANAATLPMTVTDEETLTLVRDLARIARHLGELTAAARDRWADWGTVTPHLQQAEALAADTTRCLSHAAGTYAFHTVRLAST